jgi:hypothetical protein
MLLDFGIAKDLAARASTITQEDTTRAQNRRSSAAALLECIRASADATAPDAGETARMRPGAPSGAQQGSSLERTPSDGAATPNVQGGPTPLAWAPTAPAVPQRPRPRARRWVYAAGAGGAITAGIVAWTLRAHETPTSPSAPAPIVAPAPISQSAHDPSPAISQ